MRIFLTLLAILAPSMAFAANNVTLSSLVFVEKAVPDGAGRKHIVLEEPKSVMPGDRLVFILNYRNAGRLPASDFVVTNPLPAAVVYQGGAESAQVSIDGGRNWGTLPALRVLEPDGRWRSARAEDVTHLRWVLKQAIPAGAFGKLSFRGVVR
ncbi:MAG: DUF11 domain-containing protein [Sphingomonadales bacterium]|nr:DUF11 domain-containing protein [Sphingomonadales bacterium]MBK8860001.1 DUF11 domain-containing protein [Sphingomonadales bacterium]MBL0116048.1 DUF11 domain-containing protein [Sphingomonadales bacterium]